MLPPEPTLEAIETAGGRVATHAEVHVVADLFVASGDIPRQTSYETGLPRHHTWRGGEVTLDPEIRDERFLAASVRGRGTTVLSACSHAGIVNVGLEARRLMPDQPIDVLIGGYHLRWIDRDPPGAGWRARSSTPSGWARAISRSRRRSLSFSAGRGRQARRWVERCWPTSRRCPLVSQPAMSTLGWAELASHVLGRRLLLSAVATMTVTSTVVDWHIEEGLRARRDCV